MLLNIYNKRFAMIKSYSELILMPDIKDRFDYLSIGGKVGEETFGCHRYLNQKFYTSSEWRRFRDQIIIRDNGCDLGADGFPITGKIYLHHINPISINSFYQSIEELMDPENVICVSYKMHNAIHYGDRSIFDGVYTEREKGDTILWQKII